MASHRLRAALLVAGAVAVCLAGVGAARSCSPGDEATHLTVSPATLDFGRVLYGDVGSQTVRLKNGGDHEVYVTSTIFNCSCFQIRPFNRMLKAGDERELEITFLSGNVRPERLRGKKLDIVSNDPIVPRLQVALEGDIVRAFTVLPPQVDFGPRTPEETTRQQVVKVRPGPGLDLEVVSWKVVPEGALRDVRDVNAEGGVDFTLTDEPARRERRPLRAALVLRLKVGGDGFPQRILDYRVDIAGE